MGAMVDNLCWGCDNCCLSCLGNCGMLQNCKCPLSCVGKVCCDCLMCECNCAIFPAPQSSYLADERKETEDGVMVELLWAMVRGSHKIPYFKYWTQASHSSNRCIVYFHGNGEDARISSLIVIPIVLECDITIYVVEYPTYGAYTHALPWHISDFIKQDARAFYSLLKEKTVVIMGRSIGSGPAVHLAASSNAPYLILISPFDSIRSVAQTHVKGIGCIVKNHFDSISLMELFKGRLLVIHGLRDNIIPFNHGKALYEEHKRWNHSESSVFVKPPMMTHNQFSIKQDVVQPIQQFLKSIP